MPAITKAWMAGLDDKGFEKIVAILRYWRQAKFLSVEAEGWWGRMEDEDIDEAGAKTIFWQLFIPAYLLFASMLVVLHAPRVGRLSSRWGLCPNCHLGYERRPCAGWSSAWRTRRLS